MRSYHNAVLAVLVAIGIIASAEVTRGQQQVPASPALPDSTKPSQEITASRSRAELQVRGIDEYAALQDPIRKLLDEVNSRSRPEANNGAAKADEAPRPNDGKATKGVPAKTISGFPRYNFPYMKLPMLASDYSFVNGTFGTRAFSPEAMFCNTLDSNKDGQLSLPELELANPSASLTPEPIAELLKLADELDPKKTAADRPIDRAALAEKLREIAGRIKTDHAARTEAVRDKTPGDLMKAVGDLKR